jgi:hypothetical protein
MSADADLVARPAEEDVERSKALLEAAGFTVLRLLHPVREVWPLVAHTAQHPGLVLVGVFAAAPPDFQSPRLCLPGGYHPGTRRLIHCWKPDAALPEALSL